MDQYLIGAGVPGIVLMENAGRGAAERIASNAANVRRATVLVGPGNNGGDGLVVARHLARRLPAVELAVVCACDPARLAGDAAVMRDAWKAVGGAITTLGEHDDPRPLLEGRELVVDALFGTGLARPLSGAAARCVAACVELSPMQVVALDIPSGVDADTGAILGGLAVRAHVTCTFAASKPGLHTGAGLVHAGDVHVIDLGAAVPPALAREAKLVLSAYDPPMPRRVDAHKGDAGRVLIVAGSPGRTGAALLAARGAHRGGAGLVTIASRTAAALDLRVVETMTVALADDPFTVAPSLMPALESADAVAVGPGLGLDEHAFAALDAALRHARGPVVVDADGLTLLARVRPAAGRSHRVLTPHPLELARLLGHEIGEGAARVQCDRIGAAREVARRFDATVVLKGAGTVVARPDGVCALMPYADPALGVAGSGDVLAGILAARLAEESRRGGNLDDAVLSAVHAHALAGRRATEALGGGRGVLATELADAVPSCLAGP